MNNIAVFVCNIVVAHYVKLSERDQIDKQYFVCINYTEYVGITPSYITRYALYSVIPVTVIMM